MSRLVIVSNRVVVPETREQATAAAGGLAVAIEATIRATGGEWFGWSGRISRKRPRAPRRIEVDGVTYATIDLTAEDYREYYNGFANRTLWPLFHYRPDLTAYDRQFYHGYQRVNALFAKHLSALRRPDDLVWVHDYHLIPLGSILRRMGDDQPLGFFLHIPFPATQLLLTLPQHQALIESLLAYDLVGFQTNSDLQAFRDYVAVQIGRRLSADGHYPRTGVFPIGIDTDEMAQMVQTPVGRRHFARTKRSLRGRHLIVGIDRLDYSKGLHERLRAVECLFDMYPGNRSRVVYMQVAPPSRAEVPEYRQIRRDLEWLTGHINGRFSEPDWAPIHYLNRSFTRRSLAGLYRAARVGLVTPFRDGMNLVAMEYVAAQTEEDPGVLVLSQFAGAARQLPGALIVNPCDILGVAEAIQVALRMKRDERQNRWRSMMANLRRYDLERWHTDFLNALGRVAKAA
ncbi:MAG: alpha,alpha-trehalose-phosphate synthase (UDP-forming) [Kiloniellales bacterium]